MKLTRVITLSVERPGSVITVEMGLWKDAWVVLEALDEDGVAVDVQREARTLQERANAGEDETGVDDD